MSITSIMKRYGGRAGGLLVYNAAKGAAMARNAGKQRSPLSDITKLRLGWLFPTVELYRVSLVQGASLPANWFQPDNIDGMTFGWEIYMMRSGDIDNDYEGLRLLIHELVHVRQIRDLGEGEFARRYGQQWLEHGGYENLPFEREAYSFVRVLPFDPAFYLSKWPDVNAELHGSPGAALAHWLYFGVNEGRQSAPNFSVTAYLEKNADLQAAGFDHHAAVLHWIEHGHAEGRAAT